MEQTLVIDVARQGLLIALMVSMPLLAVVLFVGVIVSVFQAVTQVQEMTLTYVPKFIAAALVIALLGNWMLTTVVTFTRVCIEQAGEGCRRMNFDAQWLFTGLLVFVRLSATLLSAPFVAANTPVTIRVFLSLILTLALTPAVGIVAQIPSSVYDVVFLVAREVLIGVTLGACIHMLLHVMHIAGSFLDLQVGLGAAQVFNPQFGQPVTLIAQFKYMLGFVLLLLVDGHHLIFGAFLETYRMPVTLGVGTMSDAVAVLGSYISTMVTLALQIAAPVAAVSVVVDAAAGFVNKAVPQMQVFLVAMPAKIGLGLVLLGFGLPLLVSIVQSGVNVAVENALRILIG